MDLLYVLRKTSSKYDRARELTTVAFWNTYTPAEDLIKTPTNKLNNQYHKQISHKHILQNPKITAQTVRY